MGSLLAKPVTDIKSGHGESSLMAFGHASMQGWRNAMEDAECAVLSLEEHPDWAFYGVYDGHGGSVVSAYCGENLHLRCARDPAWTAGDVKTALVNGFLGTDQDLFNHSDATIAAHPSGATSVVVTFSVASRQLFCANAGDSRAVLARKLKTGGFEAVALSQDHKPELPGERLRIMNAGGSIAFGRVNGSLALSRAIGDRAFKRNEVLPAEEQAVTALPDVLAVDLVPEDTFIILACDGIWDCLSNQEAVDFIAERWPAEGSPTGEQLVEMASATMHQCLAATPTMKGIGCDNMTVVLVAIKPMQ